MIEAEGEIEIRRPPAEVFAYVCDLSHAPDWLESCVKLELEPPGTWARGAALRYAYNLGGRGGSMGGTVAEYDPPRELRMDFADAMFAVTVSLRLAATPTGTRAVHSVAIEIRSFMGRVMAPVIRVGNQKQVLANLGRLKERLEKP